MKQSSLLMPAEAFPGSCVVLSFSFKTVCTRGNCAHLAVLNHRLANTFALPRGKYAHLQDCFECMLPHNPAA
ncbi:MAG: hypothetical protein FWC78_03690 [Defluviitaleaceae bacterium]|nr:hypothetical protein [Defluviitaleaceae bacterium]